MCRSLPDELLADYEAPPAGFGFWGVVVDTSGAAVRNQASRKLQ